MARNYLVRQLQDGDFHDTPRSLIFIISELSRLVEVFFRLLLPGLKFIVLLKVWPSPKTKNLKPTHFTFSVLIAVDETVAMPNTSLAITKPEDTLTKVCVY